MEQKDPKDMTASELLREADSNPCSMCHLVMTGDESCATTGCASWAYRLADKIDAELAQARELSLRRGAEIWAKANGWPDFREGEDFGAWLDRCAFAKPLDDCGEPVQIGYRVVDKVRGEIDISRISYTAKGLYFNASHNANGGRIASLITYAADEPVERIRVLGSDGKPIKEGETVWDVYGRGPAEVYRIGPADGEDGPVVWDIEGNYTMPYLLTHERPVLGADLKPIVEGETVYPIDGEWLGIPLEVLGIESLSVKVSLPSGKGWTMFGADHLTHTPPDTQERIDEDARKTTYGYWRCGDFSCGECPSEIDGKKPYERYNCPEDCFTSMKLDLLRRQRELDKRTGGAE